MQEIQFDYFHGMEAEQYTFYRIPKILFTAECFKTISCEAKVLYGLLLDRRGFGKDKKRTWYMKRPFEKRDFVAIGVGVLLLAVSLTVTIRWGRFYNPFV